MELDITGKRVMVFGLQGGGKSNFLKWLVRNTTKPALIYDRHGEFAKINRPNLWYYKPQFLDDDQKMRIELNEVINTYVLHTKKIKMVVIDEINNYCPPKPTPLPSSIRDLNDNNRHYDMTFVGACRRPVQVNSDLTELAHYKIFFVLTGKNDLLYCDSLKVGLAQIVGNLRPYQFAILDQAGNVTVHDPLPNMGTSERIGATENADVSPQEM